MISVIMGYTNRPRHFAMVLRSISESSARAVEVVVVDDGSRAEAALSTVDFSRCRFPVCRLRIPPEKKRNQNPCVAYNAAAARATGDVLLIQECSNIHAGDVLAHLEALPVEASTWREYGCYSVDRPTTDRIFAEEPSWPAGSFYPRVLAAVSPTVCRGANRDCDLAWYCHTKYRQAPFWFAAAIRRADFLAMGGFDLRFAHGRTSDDRNFVDRLGRRGSRIEYVDDPYVIHLAHDVHPFARYNQELYLETQKETDWVANGGSLFNDEFPEGLAEELP